MLDNVDLYGEFLCDIFELIDMRFEFICNMFMLIKMIE